MVKTNWFIITSNACNLCCEYCQNEPSPLLPVEPDWSVEELKKFIYQDKNPTIAFYGGEPLLNIRLIETIMDSIEVEQFTIQTNGLLLHKIPSRQLKRLSTILVSLDGDKEITDRNRSKGVYEEVTKNIEDIRIRGFKGDLVARMAITKGSNIYDDVMHLLNTEELTFDHVHFQLDCQWDEEMETRRKDFPIWVEEYNQGITKLVQYWLEMMRKGEIKGIVPFIGTFKHILNNTKTDLPCQAGLTSFAVRTDGKITFCPLPPEYEYSVVGDIYNSKMEEIKNSVRIREPCNSCKVFDLCGGRCLFANLYKLWGEEGFELTCKTVKHLIKELKGIKSEVKKLIEKGIINKDQFDYPKYNNTTEIIP